MKNFGSVSDFADERAADLLRAYFSCLRNYDHIKIAQICKDIVNMPATRFWTSPTRAAIVIADIIKHRSIDYMRPSKQEMFREIHRRVMILRQHKPDAPLAHLVAEVIEQPAPKFYISPFSAKIIILKARKKWFKEQSKKHLR